LSRQSLANLTSDHTGRTNNENHAIAPKTHSVRLFAAGSRAKWVSGNSPARCPG